MAKSIPFEQVRVRTDVEPSRGRGRSHPQGKPCTVFQWSQVHRHSTSPVEGTGQGQGSAHGSGSQVMDPTQGEQDRPCLDDEASPSEYAAPALSQVQPLSSRSVGDTPSQAAAEGEVATPIAAIAKSVQQAAAILSLSRTITDLCNGEEKQRLGPWDMALALDNVGLVGSVLQLCLAVGDLSLRFECANATALDVVSKGAARLSKLLEEELSPSLIVHIEMALR